MSPTRALFAALAIALVHSGIAHAQGQRAGLPVGKSSAQDSESLPIQLEADRIEGTPGKETRAEGSAVLRRGKLSIRADSLKFLEEDGSVEARGGVRLESPEGTISGPRVKYRLEEATGEFEKPEYSLSPRPRAGYPPVSARGQASAIEFLGENKYLVREGVLTTCKPGDDDWLIRARELELDYTREVGTARGATVVFKGLPILAAPSFDFPLNNQRQSGFLPPSSGITGKSGVEFSIPYYLNLAPNYDLTLTPRYMEKRGTQIAEQFRYLQRTYTGEFNAEELPRDKLTEERRYALAFRHSYNPIPALTGGINMNKVSDDDYFKDLATRINITSQATLPREGFLTYDGNWWEGGSYSVTGRIQRFQVLQDPTNPIVPPYGRTPQITLSALRQDIGGLDFGVLAEFVDFSHPTQVVGRRTIVYPSLTLPLMTPGAFLAPKLGVHQTNYSLDHVDPGTPETISRTVPIFSLDTGLVFERDAQIQGQSVKQTLEPRVYYVYIPFRDQNQIPVFDTAVADFNYAQIFSENMFTGGDRINDANQVTVAFTSRMLQSSTGQELLRGTLGQRYYFKDQQVTLPCPPPTTSTTSTCSTDTPRTDRTSDWLAAVSGRVTPRWTIDLGTQYNPHVNRTERLTFATRYQPEALKTLNLSYRLLGADVNNGVQSRQIDLSLQWPLGGRWFGVGRYNYSLSDRRVVENLGGLEYGADCWTSRLVVQQFALTAGATTTTLFIQLELNGFSRLGSNPLEALKRNVPGYQRINAGAPDAQKPDAPFNFYD
jgi:LPS-assembly protein